MLRDSSVVSRIARTCTAGRRPEKYSSDHGVRFFFLCGYSKFRRIT